MTALGNVNFPEIVFIDDRDQGVLHNENTDQNNTDSTDDTDETGSTIREVDIENDVVDQIDGNLRHVKFSEDICNEIIGNVRRVEFSKEISDVIMSVETVDANCFPKTSPETAVLNVDESKVRCVSGDGFDKLCRDIIDYSEDNFQGGQSTITDVFSDADKELNSDLDKMRVESSLNKSSDNIINKSFDSAQKCFNDSDIKISQNDAIISPYNFDNFLRSNRETKIVHDESNTNATDKILEKKFQDESNKNTMEGTVPSTNDVQIVPNKSNSNATDGTIPSTNGGRRRSRSIWDFDDVISSKNDDFEVKKDDYGENGGKNHSNSVLLCNDQKVVNHDYEELKEQKSSTNVKCEENTVNNSEATIEKKSSVMMKDSAKTFLPKTSEISKVPEIILASSNKPKKYFFGRFPFNSKNKVETESLQRHTISRLDSQKKNNTQNIIRNENEFIVLSDSETKEKLHNSSVIPKITSNHVQNKNIFVEDQTNIGTLRNISSTFEQCIDVSSDSFEDIPLRLKTDDITSSNFQSWTAISENASKSPKCRRVSKSIKQNISSETLCSDKTVSFSDSESVKKSKGWRSKFVFKCFSKKSIEKKFYRSNFSSSCTKLPSDDLLSHDQYSVSRENHSLNVGSAANFSDTLPLRMTSISKNRATNSISKRSSSEICLPSMENYVLQQGLKRESIFNNSDAHSKHDSVYENVETSRKEPLGSFSKYESYKCIDDLLKDISGQQNALKSQSEMRNKQGENDMIYSLSDSSHMGNPSLANVTNSSSSLKYLPDVSVAGVSNSGKERKVKGQLVNFCLVLYFISRKRIASLVQQYVQI